MCQYRSGGGNMTRRDSFERLTDQVSVFLGLVMVILAVIVSCRIAGQFLFGW